MSRTNSRINFSSETKDRAQKAEWLDLDALLRQDFPELIENDEVDFVHLQMLNATSFVPLKSEFSIWMLHDDDADMNDFLYWKRFEAITFNVFGTGTVHEQLMCQIYTLEMLRKHDQPSFRSSRRNLKSFMDAQDKVSSDWGVRSTEEAAERFITEGYGMFMSSQRGYGEPKIVVGEDYSLSFSEKMAFKRFSLRRM